jgi:hypothetical protein
MFVKPLRRGLGEAERADRRPSGEAELPGVDRSAASHQLIQ